MFIRILILKKKNLQELVETSNSLFRNLRKMVVSQREEPKIHKRLSDFRDVQLYQTVVPPFELWYAPPPRNCGTRSCA